MSAASVDPALVLFAHGARDARWAEPFARVLARVAAAAPQRDPMLAYLEFMAPGLREAVDRQVARGHRAIRIVPLFLGPGGHLRSDVPALVAEAARAHPGVDIRLAPAAGEDEGVIAALAAYSLHG
ncbi:MAG TPA: CbiX/SirB N-terminal domain-containing protein [Casimicrobiaceae bacterium]|nr:CbiX/SirB N-terminal domain-containing protein [Casimicrobiaceae bacterium]